MRYLAKCWGCDPDGSAKNDIDVDFGEVTFVATAETMSHAVTCPRCGLIQCAESGRINSQLILTHCRQPLVLITWPAELDDPDRDQAEPLTRAEVDAFAHALDHLIPGDDVAGAIRHTMWGIP